MIRGETSLFARHPALGRRIRLLEARPAREPAVELTEDEARRIDEELARYYRRARTEVAELLTMV